MAILAGKIKNAGVPYNLQGKMYYYLALFYDMFGGTELANEYYAKVVSMNSPMFFEFRLAEWRTKGKVPLK